MAGEARFRDWCRGLAAAMVAISAAPANAQTIAPDSGDTAWLLAASVLGLVTLLPGLALLQAGHARGRARTGAMAQLLAAAALGSLLWGLAGYSIAFAPGTGWTGGALNLGLANLALLREPMTVPESAFVLHQMLFALLALALLLGAGVERLRTGWLLPFAALWSLLVHAPVAHWLQSGGWLAELGAMDFAGGLTTHVSAGVSALVVAILIGPRQGFAGAEMREQRSVFAIAGAALMWVGHLALIGGSALGAGDAAATVILNGHFAACAGALGGAALGAVTHGRLRARDLASGAIAGLVALSAGVEVVGPLGAMVMGLLGGLFAFIAAAAIRHARIDDPLSVFAIHGVSGMLGALLLAPFASGALGGVGYDDGLTIGTQLVAQTVAVAAVALWSAVLTLGLSLIIAPFAPMRISAAAEAAALRD